MFRDPNSSKSVDMPGDDRMEKKYAFTEPNAPTMDAPTTVLEVLSGGKKKNKIIKIPSELRPRALYAQQSRSHFHNPTASKTWYDFEIFPKYKLSLKKDSLKQSKAIVDTILVEDKDGYIKCTIQLFDSSYREITTPIRTPQGGLTHKTLKQIKADVRRAVLEKRYSPLPDQLVENNKIYLEVKDDYVHYTLRNKQGNVVRQQPTKIYVDPAEPFVLDTLSAKIEEQVLADASSKNHIATQSMYAGFPVTNELQRANDQYSMSHNSMTVPEGSIGLVKINGKPFFVAPGKYNLDYRMQSLGSQPVTNKIIKHETLHAITVLPGELVYVEDSQDVRKSKYLLPGKHFIDSATVTIKPVVTPYGIFVRVPKTEEEFKAEQKHNPKAKNYINKYVRVPDGKAYVAHNDKGIKCVLGPGLHEIQPEWFVMEDSISTKVRDEDVEIFCQTKDNANVRVTATVTYQIPIIDKGIRYELVPVVEGSTFQYEPGKVYITKNSYDNTLSYAVTEYAGYSPTYTGKLKGITAPYPFNLEELNKIKDAIMEITYAEGHTKSLECMALAVDKIGPQNIDDKVKKIAKEIVAKQIKETDFNLDSKDGLKHAVISSDNLEKKEDAPPAYFDNSVEADIGKKVVEKLKKSKDICEGGIKILNVCIHSMELTDELAKEALAKATADKIAQQSQIQLDALKKPEVRDALVEAAAAKIIADNQHQAEMRRHQQEIELAEKREALAKKEEEALDREIEVELRRQRLAQLKAQNASMAPASFIDGARSLPVSSPAAMISSQSPVYNNTTQSTVTVHTNTVSQVVTPRS